LAEIESRLGVKKKEVTYNPLKGKQTNKQQNKTKQIYIPFKVSVACTSFSVV